MFLRPGIGFYRTEQYLWVYVSYLRMGFLDIGIKKHHHRWQEDLWLKRRRRLRNFSQIDRLPPVFGLVFWSNTYDWHVPRLSFMINFWTLLHKTFNWLYRKYATPTTTRTFVGYLSFFRGKVRVSRFTQKPCGLKNVFKAFSGYEATRVSSK